mgnify:FL=1
MALFHINGEGFDLIAAPVEPWPELITLYVHLGKVWRDAAQAFQALEDQSRETVQRQYDLRTVYGDPRAHRAHGHVWHTRRAHRLPAVRIRR